MGRVTALWRYPVKSMAGEALAEADLGWHGVAGDRRWGFVRADRPSSGFPWLTIRERPDLWRHHATLTDPSRPNGSAVTVRTPAGDELGVLDPALAASFGDGVRVMKLDRGTFDVMPVSLISTRTVASIGELVGGSDGVDVRRFRPNLVVEAYDDDPWPEDRWVGATLQVGTAAVRVDQRDKRCVLVDVDPDTADRDPSLLRAIARERDARLGVYGSVARPGSVQVGDELVLAPPA